MLYIKKKQTQNFSGLQSVSDENLKEVIKTTGTLTGGVSGTLAGAGLGVSATAGHALSNMDNGLLGGALSTAVPMAGGLLVGGLPGAALHGASGLGGYLYGRFKKNKTKKKQTLGDVLKTGTVVGLGGALAGGTLGTVYGSHISDKLANDEEYLDYIRNNANSPYDHDKFMEEVKYFVEK